MDLKDFNFIVDLVNKNSLCVAYVKQLDTNVVFNITVTNKGKAVNLTGMTLTLFIRKPDGKLVFQDKNITIIDAKAGKIKIAMKASALQAMGTAVANLDFKQGDQYSTSSNFFFHIGERIGNDDAVESEIDVPLFWELDAYIQTAIEQIEKYKALFEAFVEAGVSLEGLNDIKQYIDDNLAELKFETDEAVDLIAELKKSIANGETKRTEIVSATNKAESKRVEVVNATNTANTAKTNLETATTNANTKKTQVETATANAEAKRVELVSATNTANTSKTNLETATENADTKKVEVETATANAEKKKVEVVNATNSANTAKTGLDSSISSGNTLKTGLDASISSGTSTKTALEKATTDANAKKNEVVTATTNAENKRAEVVTATNNANTKKTELTTATTNAEAKRVEVINATNNAEAKRKELQDVIDSVGEADLVTTGQMDTALEKKLDKTGGTVTGTINATNLQVGGANVYTTSRKPTPADIGASPTSHTHSYLPLAGGTVTGATKISSKSASPFTLERTDNDANLTLVLKTPTQTKYLGIANGILKFGDSADVGGTGHVVYHSGNKPTPADIGALGATAKAVSAKTADAVAWANVTGKPSTFAPSSHTHTKSQITDMPTALKNPTAVKVQLNGGTTEGTNQFTYDGSAAKTINVTPAKIGALPSGGTAVNASKLNNKAESSAGTANTIASRDSAGDINARLLRTTYADQSTMGGAIAFRTNNSTDNYTRYCNSPTAVRNWLGASPTSHTHSYLPLSGGTVTNNINYNMFNSTQTPLKVFGGDANGQGISVGAGGATIVGAGESARAMEGVVNPVVEDLTLCADNAIELITNCDTIANRRRAIIDTSLRFYPGADKVGTLGKVDRKWSQVHADQYWFSNDDYIYYNDTSNFYNFVADGAVANSGIDIGNLLVNSIRPRSVNVNVTLNGASLFVNTGSASGSNWLLNRAFTGGSGTECSFYPDKAGGYGWVGSSGFPMYKGYSYTWHTVSKREAKYQISKANPEDFYEYVKGLNVYSYRHDSSAENPETGEFDVNKRGDLQLGCMIDELPIEVVDYDTEGGDGKAVDLYAYTSMVLGATKEVINKVEVLEKENEELRNRVDRLEELLNGIINKG